METQTENYDISFFKPTTELARINRNLTIKLLIIWAVAIFGFHAFMRLIETPTPEPAYLAFEQVWGNVKSGNGTIEEKQTFAKSTLSVLGKLLVQPADKEVLDKVLNYVSYSLVADDKKDDFVGYVSEFNKIKEVATSLSDEKYVAFKTKIIEESAVLLNVESYSLEAKLMPFELSTEYMSAYDAENNKQVEAVMAKYLIHNQSFLTDTIVFGYPFHYFYTSVFLLILFIVICWVYCYRIDKIHKELGIEG